jgi:hypothetical protein
MTAEIVKLLEKAPHKHYVRIDAEIVPRSTQELTCSACNGLILAGNMFAVGKLETCKDPGTELTMIWCKTCFTSLGRGSKK